ncbi:ribonuclease H-like domain-containing protein [Candidatus Woesearchaeota archaeon]|nr:ribonuclease H-like domain-containing protein [Candidatus Woesearchaeota archaeon]
MNIKFYPVDITYSIEDGKPLIFLYGRTAEGEQICVIDDSFKPYFIVTGKPELDALKAVKQDDYVVTDIVKAKKNLNETETDAHIVYVNLPKAAPELQKLARKIKGVTGAYEHDIPFTRRYLIDKGITPLTQVIVDAEKTTRDFRVPCYFAKNIKSGDETATPLKILALDIETYNPDNKLDFKKNPILMIALYGEKFSRVITWKKFKTEDKTIEFVQSEADMLARFVELVHQFKPDMITGYFTDGFDFPYIFERAKILKVKLDLGLDNSALEIAGRKETEAKIAGIAHIDIFKFIKRVIGRGLKTDSYSLDAVSKELLGKQKHKVDMDHFFKVWDKGGEELEPFCKYNLQDTLLTYELTEKVLPTLIEFVRIMRLPPYDINRMPYSMFVEWYLINQAHQRGEIILSKPEHTEEGERMRERIQGAFVYEPKPGYYQNLVVFDYRSLYPSIIASHNISKGLVNCECCKDAPKIETERGTFWYCQKRKGLFATIISDLILIRAEVKKQLKKKSDNLLAARSEALKVLANSFYGYMGFAPARWYCIECAESTTAWARHYIHKAIDTAKEAGFTVLYSDTDSVFLLLEKKTKEQALALMDEINKKLPGLMELDFEGYYPSGIFVSLKAGEGGAKKKYALLNEKGELKIKGFETVRRNWSYIAKEVQQNVLSIILKENDPKKAKNYVREVIDSLRKNKLEVSKVIIKTQLTKATGTYTSVGPHVAAAQRMEAKGMTVSSGSIIKYVVIKGKGKIRDKVKLPEETSQDEYDGEYYIQNQIIPGIERIFAVLNINVDDLMSETKQSSLFGYEK